MYVHTAPSCRRSVCAAKTVRILAIGNSFSQDAVEQYLHELAEAEGISTIIGNMFIGGCSLERHVKNARDNAPAYAYRKIGTDGKKREKARCLWKRCWQMKPGITSACNRQVLFGNV